MYCDDIVESPLHVMLYCPITCDGKMWGECSKVKLLLYERTVNVTSKLSLAQITGGSVNIQFYCCSPWQADCFTYLVVHITRTKKVTNNVCPSMFLINPVC